MTQLDCTFKPVPWYGILLGVLIAIGICVSFIPQHYLFIKNKSAEGVSFLMVFISNVAAFCVFMATVIFSWGSIECSATGQLSFWEVHITLLSVYTLLIPVINYAIIFFFVATLQKSDGSREQEASKHGIRWAFYGTMLFMADVVVVTLLLIWAAGYDSYIVINFARGLSVVTIIGTLTQFLPQIYTTFRCKTGGDLSLLMLCIQAPGSGAIAILQGVVYGMPPAVWVPYVISMSQMAVLGGQIVYYDYIINPKKQEQQIEIPDTFQHLNIQDGSTPGLPIWKEE